MEKNRNSVTVLIADDEPLMRQGLTKLLERPELGFVLIGSCHDGSKAFQIAMHNQINILITDIRMPGMDGLELSRHIQTQKIKTKIVIISGYSQFEYARQAMRYGVVDYFLKPIDNDKLLDCLQRIRNEIIKSRKDIQKEQENREMSESMRKLLMEKTLFELAEGKPVPMELRKAAFDLSGIEAQGDETAVAIFNLENSDSKQYSRSIIEDVIQNYKMGYSWIDYNSNICVLFIFEHRNYGNVVSLVRETVESIAKVCHVCASVSSAFKSQGGILLVNSPYQEARQRLKGIVFSGLIFADTDPHVTIPDGFCRESLLCKETLYNQVKYGDVKGSEETVDKYINSWRSCPSIMLEENLKALLTEISCLLLELGMDRKILEEVLQDRSIILRYGNVEELKRWFKKIIIEITAEVQKLTIASCGTTVRKAIAIMESNDALEMTINDIANSIKINSNYLSHLFKIQTGKTAIEYLTEIRIRKAKELLLSTNLKSYAIARTVGYTDSQYFSQVFKRCTGVSPGQFRRSLG
jgi:two-component system response regulator YesN